MGATTEDRYFALIEGSKRFVRTGCGVLRCGGVLRHAAKTMQHAAINPQVTISHPPSGRLPLLSARPAVTFQAAASPPLCRYQVILLDDRGT